MKKCISVVLVLSMLLLSACNGGPAKQITVAEAGYTCDAFVEYGENFSSNVLVKAIGGGMFSLTVKTPEDIAGLTFSFDNSEMSIQYNGIESETVIPNEYGGFADVLNEIFLKFTTSKPDVPYKDGAYLLEGSNSEYSFLLTFNEKGFPLSLLVKEKNLNVTFSNWTY